MTGRRRLAGTALLGGLLLVAAPSVHGQTGGNSGSNSGIGLVPTTGVGGSQGGFGVLAVPMMPNTSQGGSSATGVNADPLGVSAVYGPALPMTNGQAGLFLLSTQQRMLGLGNGQLSGTRPGWPRGPGPAGAP